MDGTTLFKLPLEDWKSLASLFFSPAVGLVAIYVFGADLAKLPFIPADIPYRPPAQFIRAVAVLLSYLFALSLSVWLTLRLYAGPLPNVDAFRHQFFRDLSVDETRWLARANSAGVVGGRVSIIEYDGLSDARVFVNNVRIFGTHVDCMFQYQCARNTQQNVPQFKAEAKKFQLNSLYPQSDPRVLPYSRDFSTQPQGLNYIELFANNSGPGRCNITIEIELLTSGGDRLARVFRMTSTQNDYGRYETNSMYGSYRVCDQIQLVVNPGKLNGN